MLSQKFKLVIDQLIKDKLHANEYDKSLKKYTYEMELSYSEIFPILCELGTNQKLDTDQCNFHNYICNGILSDSNGCANMSEGNIKNLLYLDYMEDDSQKIINELLLALDTQYVLKTKISDKLTTEMWEFTLLKIHFLTCFRRIYFVWKTDQMLYMPDIIKYIELVKKINSKINISPIDAFFNLKAPMYYFCEAKNSDILNMFQYIESLVEKYSFINIFKTTHELKEKELKEKELREKELREKELKEKNIKEQQLEIKKLSDQYSKDLKLRDQKLQMQKSEIQKLKQQRIISINDLDNLKVPGLRELCIKLKLNTTRCQYRRDYIKLLKPYIEE